jgi:hypothetical protein
MNTTLDIYHYVLDGYTVNKKPEFTYLTEDIYTTDNETECGIISVTSEALNEYNKHNIRTCDSLSGKLLRVNKMTLNQKNIIELNLNKLKVGHKFNLVYKNIKISSDDMIKFTSIYAIKMKNRTKIDYLGFKDIYDRSNIDTILNDILNVLKNDTNFNVKENTLIKKIDKINKKFIVIGDIHGSFASFTRILIRLRGMNILDKGGKLLNNYNIIFLGDIVDRGIYGYEVIIIIFILKLLNPGSVNINRGNHEENNINTKYGFKKQLNIQFGKDNNIHSKVNNCLEYLHSGLLLYDFNADVNNRKYIYLSHGGLPISNNDLYLKEEHLNNNNNLIIPNNLIEYNYGANSIRWSDYHNQITIDNNNRSRTKIGTNIIKEAMKLGIDLILRGHQDSISNAKILSIDNTKNQEQSFEYFQNIVVDNNKYECSKYTHRIEIKDKKVYINNESKETYLPVIVLSTNTDYARDLFFDCFAILNDYETKSECKSKNIIDYKNKYIKYKLKYLKLKETYKLFN